VPPTDEGFSKKLGLGIRLANWDVVRLATKIKSGDKVSIH
jgi:hypothetical protein